MQAPTTAPPPSPRPRLALALAVFASALALYGLTRQTVAFSDGVLMAARVARDGPVPYYNVLYLPLAWAFTTLLRPLAGWDAYVALGWFSAACGAASAVVLLRSLARSGIATGTAVGWIAVFALTPGVWFFATTAEVHALQLLGVCVAVDLALAARTRTPARALGLVLLASALALLAHLTTVLLLPGLLVLASGGAPGRGLRLGAIPARAWIATAAALLAGAAALAWVFSSDSERLARTNPLQMLVVFGREYARRMASGGLYAPDEVVAFLDAELVRPAALLLLAPFLGLAARRAHRLLVATGVAALPYLVLLPQGGVREGGAYYLSLYPLFVLAGAVATDELRQRWPGPAWGIALAVALGALGALGAQGALAWRRIERWADQIDPRVWAERVAAIAPPESDVFTVSLPRWHALLQEGKYGGIDLRRELELVPRSLWDQEVRAWLGIAGGDLRAGRRVYLDADLFDDPDAPPFFRRFAEILGETPVRLEPRPPDVEHPLLYEVIRRP
jgi:hypothetical protein